MRVCIWNRLIVSEPTPELLRWCKEHLVIDNPEYEKKQRMHFWTGNTPRKLYLMEYIGDKLVLPYGCLNAVLNSGKPENIKVTSGFGIAQSVDYCASVPLYDYQETAKNAMIDAYYGILQSPAGSGKTQIGIALAVELGVKTLWLTHTKDLLNQSKSRAEQYISSELTGTITEGKVNIGKGITFATVQTLSNLDLSLYKDTWDCIIVDECHRVAGTPTAVTQFSKVLNSLAARHKYGLSATVHRSDGMIAATYALLGNVAYQVPDNAVADKIMSVSIQPRPTGLYLDEQCLDTDGTIIYAKLIKYLTESYPRNRIILGDLISNCNHYNLILSDRLEHLKNLLDGLPPELQALAVMIDGKMTSKKAKAEREQAIEDMRQGKKRYLFATYSLAKEGLDIPRLDRLYMTTPQKDYAVITQSIGRIARTFADKQDAISYDYVDDGIIYLLRRYKKRCTIYRKQHCAILEEDRICNLIKYRLESGTKSS